MTDSNSVLIVDGETYFTSAKKLALLHIDHLKLVMEVETKLKLSFDVGKHFYCTNSTLAGVANSSVELTQKFPMGPDYAMTVMGYSQQKARLVTTNEEVTVYQQAAYDVGMVVRMFEHARRCTVDENGGIMTNNIVIITSSDTLLPAVHYLRTWSNCKIHLITSKGSSLDSGLLATGSDGGILYLEDLLSTSHPSHLYYDNSTEAATFSSAAANTADVPMLPSEPSESVVSSGTQTQQATTTQSTRAVTTATAATSTATTRAAVVNEKVYSHAQLTRLMADIKRIRQKQAPQNHFNSVKWDHLLYLRHVELTVGGSLNPSVVGRYIYAGSMNGACYFEKPAKPIGQITGRHVIYKCLLAPRDEYMWFISFVPLAVALPGGSADVNFYFSEVEDRDEPLPTRSWYSLSKAYLKDTYTTVKCSGNETVMSTASAAMAATNSGGGAERAKDVSPPRPKKLVGGLESVALSDSEWARRLRTLDFFKIARRDQRDENVFSNELPRHHDCIRGTTVEVQGGRVLGVNGTYRYAGLMNDRAYFVNSGTFLKKPGKFAIYCCKISRNGSYVWFLSFVRQSQPLPGGCTDQNFYYSLTNNSALVPEQPWLCMSSGYKTDIEISVAVAVPPTASGSAVDNKSSAVTTAAVPDGFPSKESFYTFIHAPVDADRPVTDSSNSGGVADKTSGVSMSAYSTAAVMPTPEKTAPIIESLVYANVSGGASTVVIANDHDSMEEGECADDDDGEGDDVKEYDMDEATVASIQEASHAVSQTRALAAEHHDTYRDFIGFNVVAAENTNAATPYKSPSSIHPDSAIDDSQRSHPQQTPKRGRSNSDGINDKSLQRRDDTRDDHISVHKKRHRTEPLDVGYEGTVVAHGGVTAAQEAASDRETSVPFTTTDDGLSGQLNTISFLSLQRAAQTDTEPVNNFDPLNRAELLALKHSVVTVTSAGIVQVLGPYTFAGLMNGALYFEKTVVHGGQEKRLLIYKCHIIADDSHVWFLSLVEAALPGGSTDKNLYYCEENAAEPLPATGGWRCMTVDYMTDNMVVVHVERVSDGTGPTDGVDSGLCPPEESLSENSSNQNLISVSGAEVPEMTELATAELPTQVESVFVDLITEILSIISRVLAGVTLRTDAVSLLQSALEFVQSELRLSDQMVVDAGRLVLGCWKQLLLDLQHSERSVSGGQEVSAIDQQQPTVDQTDDSYDTMCLKVLCGVFPSLAADRVEERLFAALSDIDQLGGGLAGGYAVIPMHCLCKVLETCAETTAERAPPQTATTTLESAVVSEEFAADVDDDDDSAPRTLPDFPKLFAYFLPRLAKAAIRSDDFSEAVASIANDHRVTRATAVEASGRVYDFLYEMSERDLALEKEGAPRQKVTTFAQVDKARGTARSVLILMSVFPYLPWSAVRNGIDSVSATIQHILTPGAVATSIDKQQRGSVHGRSAVALFCELLHQYHFRAMHQR